MNWTAWLAATVLVVACAEVGPIRQPRREPPAFDATTYADQDIVIAGEPVWDAMAARVGGKVHAEHPDDGTAAPAQNLACSGTSPKPDGTCCPSGQGWSKSAGACIAADALTCAAAACGPRWCWDWRTAKGEPCAGPSDACRAEPRTCSAAERVAQAGCLAGSYPTTTGCAAVGAAIAQPGGTVVSSGQALPAQPPAIPPDLTLAPPAEAVPPLWCLATDGSVAADCGAAKVACQVGQVMNSQGQCAKLGDYLPSVCPPGTLTANGACAPDPADCAAGPWPTAPAGSVLYVSSGVSGPGTGTAAAPFATLQQALAVAKAGTAILVANGSYALGDWVGVAPGVTVRGRCAAGVVLQSSAGLQVQGTLDRVTVVGTGAVPLNVGAGGVASRIAVVGGSLAAVDLGGTLVDAWVSPNGAMGIRVTKGSAALQRVRIDQATGRGLAVFGGATLQAKDVVVSNTGLSKSNEGIGLLAAEGSQVSVDGLIATGQATAGVLAADAKTLLQLQRFSVSNTLPQLANQSGGQGLLAIAGAKLVANHGALANNHGSGVLAHGQGAAIVAGNLSVSTTLGNPDGYTGDGVRVQSGGSVSATSVWMTDNRAHGVLCSGSGSQLSLSGAVVRNTQPRQLDEKAGQGIWIEAGCVAQLHQVRAAQNRTAGLVISGNGTQVTGSVLTIDGTLAQKADGKQGFGVLVADGGRLTLQRLLVHGNRTVGLQVEGQGAQVALGDWADGKGGGLVLTTVHPALANGKTGWGISVAGGASLQVRRMFVSGAREAALAVSGKGSSLAVRDAWLVDTLAGPIGEMGRGLVVEAQAQATVERLVVLQARQAGVSVQGAQLHGDDMWIAHTQPDVATAGQPGPGQYGRGITVAGQASVELRRLRLTGHREAALSVYDGAQVQVRDAIIDATQAQPAGAEAGRAVDVLGAQLTLLRVWLKDSVEVAAAVAGKGAQLRLYDAAVDGIAPGKPGTAGHGLSASGGGLLVVAGGRVLGSRDAAVVVHAGKAQLSGLLVDAVQPRSDGSAGHGIAAAQAASVVAAALAVKGARTAAILLRKSELNLQGAAVAATQIGSFAGAKHVQEAGDGLALIESLSVLNDVWVTGSARAGLVVSGGTANLRQVALTGNGVGWSAQGLAQLTLDAVVATGNAVAVWTGGAVSQPPAIPAPAPRLTLYPLTF